MAGLFLLLFFLVATLWVYGGYLLFIAVLARISNKKNNADLTFTPEATIIIPTYNEEQVIEEKLKNLLAQDYPRNKLQVLVVDSGSTDRTTEVVQRFLDYGVELLSKKERKGKAGAIKYTLDFCRHGIIVVTDANSYFEPLCLRFLLRHFSDPRVGGVTGRYSGWEKVKGPESQGTVFFRKYENALRRYESQVDSVVSLFGELFACRKNLCLVDEKNLSEDFETSVYIRRKGYRLIYESGSGVYEYAPHNRQDLINQRRRIIIGTIQTLWKHKSVLFNPRYGLYGMVILPSHKLFPVLSPFFLTAFLVVALFFFRTVLIFFVFLLTGLFGVVALLHLFVKKAPSPFYIATYVILVNFSCLLAWKDYFCGNYTVKWEKMESSRIVVS